MSLEDLPRNRRNTAGWIVFRLWMVALSGLCLAAVAWGKAARPSPTAVSTYIQNAPFGFDLSPNGVWLAFINKVQGRNRVFTRNIETGKGSEFAGVPGEPQSVTWVDNKRLIIVTKESGQLHLVSSDPTGEHRLSFPVPKGGRISMVHGQVSPFVSGHFYYWLRLKSRKGKPDMLSALSTKVGGKYGYRIDEIDYNPANCVSLLFSPTGSLVGGISQVGSESKLWTAEKNAKGGYNWVEAYSAPVDRFPKFSAFACPAGYLLGEGYFGKERASVRLFYTKTRKFGRTVLATDKGFISGVIFSPDSRRIGGYDLYDGWPDEIVQSRQLARLEHTVRRWIHAGRDEEITPVALADDGRAAVVADTTETGMPIYWHVDTRLRKAFEIYVPREREAKHPHCRIVPWRVKARDGLELPCYLMGKIPHSSHQKIVLFVDGGPFAGVHRKGLIGSWEYLAANGVCVVGMNYRGSKGYGRRFWQAGVGQGATGMVHDVEDVVRAIRRQPWGKRGSLTICADSFGGWLSLNASASIKNDVDDLVLWDPLTDVDALYQRFRKRGFDPKWVSYERKLAFGKSSVRTEADLLGAFERTGLPLLLVQSQQDEKIAPKISARFVADLKKAGCTAELMPVAGTHEDSPVAVERTVLSRILKRIQHTNRRTN